MSSGILMVEDDTDLAEVMELALVGAGYKVRTAHDGIEALRQVQRGIPALILLDMCMPGMDGWDFARAFRSRYGDGVPIVVVTAAEHARRRGAEVPAQGVLSKPFNLDALRAVVAKHLGARLTAGGG
jgi:DNA-binding response OmpR family regulator